MQKNSFMEQMSDFEINDSIIIFFFFLLKVWNVI